MAEDEDLEVLCVLVAAMLASADDESNEGADNEVEERPHRPIPPGWHERESGFLSPTRSRKRSAVRSSWIGVIEMRLLRTAWTSVPGIACPVGGGPPTQ